MALYSSIRRHVSLAAPLSVMVVATGEQCYYQNLMSNPSSQSGSHSLFSGRLLRKFSSSRPPASPTASVSDTEQICQPAVKRLARRCQPGCWGVVCGLGFCYSRCCVCFLRLGTTKNYTTQFPLLRTMLFAFSRVLIFFNNIFKTKCMARTFFFSCIPSILLY